MLTLAIAIVAVIYGILRDAAYRLRRLAEEECDKHRAAGKWDEDEAETVRSV